VAVWPLAAQTLSFTPHTVPAGNSPTSVRLIDFNGDNKLDIVVINADGSDTLSVLLNQGNGNFSAPVTGQTGGAGAIALTSGDFNHDGKADLAVVNNQTNNVSILLGNGDGTFRLGSFAATDAGPVSITEADFNRDGNTDLAVVNSLTGNVPFCSARPTVLSGKEPIFLWEARPRVLKPAISMAMAFPTWRLPMARWASSWFISF